MKKTQTPRSKRPVRPSLIKGSKEIRDALKQRMKELNINLTDIVRDAQKRKAKVELGALSKFLSYGNVPGTLSETSIRWLCARYDIPLAIVSGNQRIVGNKVVPTLEPIKKKP